MVRSNLALFEESNSVHVLVTHFWSKKIKIKTNTHLGNKAPTWTDFEVTERISQPAISDRRAIKMLPKQNQQSTRINNYLTRSKQGLHENFRS